MLSRNSKAAIVLLAVFAVPLVGLAIRPPARATVAPAPVGFETPGGADIPDGVHPEIVAGIPAQPIAKTEAITPLPRLDFVGYTTDGRVLLSVQNTTLTSIQFFANADDRQPVLLRRELVNDQWREVPVIPPRKTHAIELAGERLFQFLIPGVDKPTQVGIWWWFGKDGFTGKGLEIWSPSIPPAAPVAPGK
jgi:hypothetical protein